MKKPPLQDVIVKNSKSRRPARGFVDDDTPVQKRRLDRHNDSFENTKKRHRSSDTDTITDSDFGGFSGRKKGSKKWIFIALGIGFIVVLSSVVLSIMFAGAFVTVYPKQDTVVVNTTFNAEVESADGVLSVENIVLEKTEKAEVPALGEENVEERAKGKIVIYNKYSETPQRLIKNTRFKSSKNLIYRIRESVEIPGMKTNGAPGEKEVMVYAEEPGEKYNMGADSFTIPGFKGLPQEGKVYAKSTEEIKGGFVGVRHSVNEKERASTLKKLETQLRDELLSAAFENHENPEGYILFKDAVFFEFNPLPDESIDKGKVTLSLSGKLHGVLFKEDDFVRQVASLTLSSYKNEPIRISNIKDLTVLVAPKKDENEDILPWQATKFEVKVQGKAHFIWEYDKEKLAKDFAGKSKDIINTPLNDGILGGYPGIDRLDVSIRPFWKNTFPEDVKRITIITELDD